MPVRTKIRYNSPVCRQASLLWKDTIMDEKNKGTAGLKDRRGFLTEAGTYGSLLIGGTYLAMSSPLETELSAQAETRETKRPVKDDGLKLRGFAVVRRAPGQSRKDVRRKALVPLSGYSRACLNELTTPVNARQTSFVQCYVNDASYAAEGVDACPMLSERDFVSEWLFAVDPNPPAPPAAPAVPPRRPPRGPALPDWGESGTDIRLIMKQLFAQGDRLLAIPGREKGMHFIKMASTVPAADHLKVWQDLHAKAMGTLPEMFSNAVLGYELLQRMPDTAAKQASRCGGEMTVPDLVSQFWSKTNPGSQQFLNYARAIYKADTNGALDKVNCFALMLEEWEGMMSGNAG